MKTIKIILASFLLLTLFSCASTEHKKRGATSQTLEPVSKQVIFIESSGVGLSMYKAVGIGNTMEDAAVDAKRAALWAALYLGDQALLNSPEAKNKFNSVANKYYSNVDKYVRYVSSLLSKKVSGEKYKLKYNISIDVGLLREDLQSDGIISNNDVVNAKIGLPSVIVLPKTMDAKIAANTVEQYLSEQGFSLVDKKSNEKVVSLTKKIAQLSGQVDPLYLLASQTGADIYIETIAKVQNLSVAGVKGQQASVQIRAYDTATSQLLASATGYSAKRAGTASDVLIQEAANDAANKLTAKLIKVWQKQAKMGNWFKLVVSFDPDKADVQNTAFYKTLKSIKPTQMKRLQAGQHTVTYLVRVKDVSDALELFMKIKKNYTGPGDIKRELEVGKLLIIRLDNNNGEMQLD